MEHTKRLRALALVLGSIGLILLSLVGALAWWFFGPGYDRIPFSAAAWKQADPETRGHMVNDLLSSRDFAEMPQGELLNLLGEPDGSWTVDEARTRDGVHASEAELQLWYGSVGPGFLAHVTYRLGYMGGRPGAPFVFPYTLHVLLRDGKVTRLYVDD